MGVVFGVADFLVCDKDEDEGSELRSEVGYSHRSVWYGVVLLRRANKVLLQGDGPFCRDKKTPRAVVSGSFQGSLGL